MILDEVKKDIQQMLVLISAFTEPNTQGESLLEDWKEKYFDKEV